MNSTAPRLATANALAFSVVTAIHGIASCETCEPNSLIVWPVHSFRKSPWCQSAPLGRSRRSSSATIAGPVEACHEAVDVAVRRLACGELLDDPPELPHEAL